MAQIRVRSARVGDTADVVTLFQEAVVSIPDYSPKLRRLFFRKYRSEIVTKRIRDRAAYCLLAVDGKTVVGFIWGMPMRATEDGVYWMNWVGVHAAYRRRGVARRMMKALEAELRKHQFHKLWFNIDPKNSRSAKTFAALGYHQIARVKHHWYGHDALLWEKDLMPTKKGM